MDGKGENDPHLACGLWFPPDLVETKNVIIEYSKTTGECLLRDVKGQGDKRRQNTTLFEFSLHCQAGLPEGSGDFGGYKL